MELENTVFFNRPSVVFSDKNRNISYPILKYITKYVIFCHVHVFFYWFRGISRNSIDCAVLRDFRSISRNREIPEGLFIGVTELHKQNYGGPQVPRQKRKAHGKKEKLTAKKKSSRQKNKKSSRQKRKAHG